MALCDAAESYYKIPLDAEEYGRFEPVSIRRWLKLGIVLICATCVVLLPTSKVSIAGASPASTSLHSVDFSATASLTGLGLNFDNPFSARPKHKAKRKRKKATYTIGEFVERRNTGEKWGCGYVTQEDPLKVTTKNDPDDKGVFWEEVRKVEVAAAPAEEELASKQTARGYGRESGRGRSEGGRKGRGKEGRRTTGTELPKINSVHKGRIVSVTTFGAFMQLGDGSEYKEGLIPKSCMSASGRVDKVEDVVSMSQTVYAKVVRVNDVNGTYTLDMRSVDQATGEDTDPTGLLLKTSKKRNQADGKGKGRSRGEDRGGAQDRSRVAHSPKNALESFISENRESLTDEAETVLRAMTAIDQRRVMGSGAMRNVQNPLALMQARIAKAREMPGSCEGTVVRWSQEKGFGFIDYQGEDDMFVMAKNCIDGRPQEGDYVSFDIEERANKPGQQEAVRVYGCSQDSGKGSGKGKGKGKRQERPAPHAPQEQLRRDTEDAILFFKALTGGGTTASVAAPMKSKKSSTAGFDRLDGFFEGFFAAGTEQPEDKKKEKVEKKQSAVPTIPMECLETLAAHKIQRPASISEIEGTIAMLEAKLETVMVEINKWNQKKINDYNTKKAALKEKEKARLEKRLGEMSLESLAKLVDEPDAERQEVEA